MTLPPALRGSGSRRTLTYWNLEVGEHAAGEPHQLGRAGRRAGKRNDGGRDLTAKRFVGHAEHCDLGDGGVRREGILDLGAVHVLPAAVDHIVSPVEQLDRTVGADPRDVAGAQPAVRQGGA